MDHRKHKFLYSEEERRKYQNPESILQSIGLREGMRFIDVGSNDGFFTLPAARIVGPKGQVVAIDTDQEALGRLVIKLEAESLSNTKVITKAAEEVIVADHYADIIFYGTVLHDFYDPIKVLKNSRRMLKNNGIIYDYDWRKIRSPLGPPLSIRFSQEHVEDLAQQAGLVVDSSETIDSNYYAVTLKRSPA